MKRNLKFAAIAGFVVMVCVAASAQTATTSSRVSGTAAGQQVTLGGTGKLVPIAEWFTTQQKAFASESSQPAASSGPAASIAAQTCPPGRVPYGSCVFNFPETPVGQLAGAQHRSGSHVGGISATCMTGGQWAFGNATCDAVGESGDGGAMAAGQVVAHSGSVGGMPSSDTTNPYYTDRTSSFYDPNYELAQRYAAANSNGANGNVVYRGVATTDQIITARSKLQAELKAVLDDPSRTVQEKAAAQQMYDQGMAGISAAVEYKGQTAVAQQISEVNAARQAHDAAVADVKDRAITQLRLAGVGESAIPAVLKRIDEESVATATTSPNDSKLVMVNGRLESQSLQLLLSQIDQAMRADMAQQNITEAQWKSRQRKGDPQVTASGTLAQ